MRSLFSYACLGALYGTSFILPAFDIPAISLFLRLALASVSILILMKRVWNCPSISLTFLGMWIFGLSFFMVSLFGIYSAFQFAHQLKLFLPCLFFLSAGFGFYFTFVGILAKVGSRKSKGLFSILFSSFFVLSEVLRGNGILSFPWNFVSHLFCFEDSPIVHNLLPIVRWLSIYSLSALWLFLLSAIFYRHLKWIGGMLASLVGVFVFGYFQNALFPLPSSSPFHLLVVQPNISQAIKLDPAFNATILQNTIQLTVAAQTHFSTVPDLIVWPETAVPQTLDAHSNVFSSLQKCIADPSSYLIFGADRIADTSQSSAPIWHNSMYIVSKNQILDIYDKAQLLPFGEYIPFRHFLPTFFNRILGGIDCTPGSQKEIALEEKKITFWPVICSESVFQRRLPKRAIFTLQILNDGWFAPSMLWQHLAADRLRTVESGRPLVRVANNGISALITATGKIEKTIPLTKDGYMMLTLSREIEKD